MGIDLGTSSVKVNVIDEGGSLIGGGRSDYPTYSDEPAMAEQSPTEWLRSLHVAAGEALVQAGEEAAGNVQAVGLTGQLPTLVALSQGRGVGRAITWLDSRANDWALARVAPDLRKEIYARTGMPIDGRYIAPMYAYHLAKAEKRVDRILSGKDYIYHVLTGEDYTDPSTAAGYGVYSLAGEAWDEELCSVWGVPQDLLPTIGPAASSFGRLTADAVLLLGLSDPVPVYLGAAVSVASAYAMGAMSEDAAAVVSGTSTIVMGASRSLHLDGNMRYLVTPHAFPGWYGYEMDLLGSGISHNWLSALFGWEDGTLERLASEAEPGAQGLLFAPYLAGGEQGALWNAQVRGVLHGLTFNTTQGDLARALLEGIQFEIRRCIEVLGHVEDVRRILLGGPATADGITPSLLADVTGKKVSSMESFSAALGAALLAASGEKGTQVQPASKPWGSEHVPSRSRHDLYERIYHRYVGLFPECAETWVAPG
ncbi:MAG: FGGY family carbohydrate kinase [Deinococcales bacterium]